MARNKEDKMQVQDFVLEFKPKVDRAINNLGDDYTPEQLLAEYDRLGGHITYQGNKVKMGSFFDHKKKEAIASPQPVVIKKREVVEEAIVEEEVVTPAKKAKKEEVVEEVEEEVEEEGEVLDAPAPKKRAAKKK